MDVTGPATVTVPLPLSESFNLGGMPDGNWTFRFRALNAAGSSSQSSSVSLTAPSTNCALPRVPTSFQATKAGNVVSVSWDTPSGGTPAASYRVTVSGTHSVQFPTAGLGFASPAPPGTYNISVQAVNACGAGPATAYQTVVIQ
jgi:predicted phage tail protein